VGLAPYGAFRDHLPLMLGWFSLNIFWPMDWAMPPRTLALLSGVPQAVTFVIAVLGLRRAFLHGHLESPARRVPRAAALHGAH
jgi:hypothetical protein